MTNHSYAQYVRNARLQRSAALGAFIGGLAVSLWRRLRPHNVPAVRPGTTTPRIREQFRWAVSQHDRA
jgi:hypothetical protein